MTTIDTSRHQRIRQLVMHRPEAMPAATVYLWERLAIELIAIIGEGGFQSIFSRSVLINSTIFPWLVSDHPWQQTDPLFTGLKASLEGQEPAEAGEASIGLLIVFIDILTELIGDSLATSILRTAWGDDALEPAAKEY
jgi:hypothetical protein